MSRLVKVEISVQPETASALRDAQRAEAIGRLIDRLVRPADAEDPLRDVLQATRTAARDAGLADHDIERELEAYRAERRG